MYEMENENHIAISVFKVHNSYLNRVLNFLLMKGFKVSDGGSKAITPAPGKFIV